MKYRSEPHGYLGKSMQAVGPAHGLPVDRGGDVRQLRKEPGASRERQAGRSWVTELAGPGPVGLAAQ